MKRCNSWPYTATSASDLDDVVLSTDDGSTESDDTSSLATEDELSFCRVMTPDAFESEMDLFSTLGRPHRSSATAGRVDVPIQFLLAAPQPVRAMPRPQAPLPAFVPRCFSKEPRKPVAPPPGNFAQVGPQKSIPCGAAPYRNTAVTQSPVVVPLLSPPRASETELPSPLGPSTSTPPPPAPFAPSPLATRPIAKTGCASDRQVPMPAVQAPMGEPAVQPINGKASAGSYGHPYNCQAACKYFSKSLCKDGAACERCHLCPWTRANGRAHQKLHAAKKQQAAARFMPPACGEAACSR